MCSSNGSVDRFQIGRDRENAHARKPQPHSLFATMHCCCNRDPFVIHVVVLHSCRSIFNMSSSNRVQFDRSRQKWLINGNNQPIMVEDGRQSNLSIGKWIELCTQLCDWMLSGCSMMTKISFEYCHTNLNIYTIDVWSLRMVWRRCFQNITVICDKSNVIPITARGSHACSEWRSRSLR